MNPSNAIRPRLVIPETGRYTSEQLFWDPSLRSHNRVSSPLTTPTTMPTTASSIMAARAQNQPPPSFTRFGELPTELRLLIWHMALEDPMLKVMCRNHLHCLETLKQHPMRRFPMTCRHDTWANSLLHTCVESRDVALACLAEYDSDDDCNGGGPHGHGRIRDPTTEVLFLPNTEEQWAMHIPVETEHIAVICNDDTASFPSDKSRAHWEAWCMIKLYEEHVRIDDSLRGRGNHGGGLDSLTLLLPESYRWRKTHVGDGPFHYGPEDMVEAEIAREFPEWYNNLPWPRRGRTGRHPPFAGNVCIAYYKGTPELPLVSLTPGAWLEATSRYGTAAYARDHRAQRLR